MKHHTVDDRWGWIERITGALIIVAVVVALLLAITAASAGADSGTPYKVTTTGTLTDVNCYGPTCCGQVFTVIEHVRYETFREYCRWWPKTIRNGQKVRATMYRTDLNVW
jgi:hypothetical protein